MHLSQLLTEWNEEYIDPVDFDSHLDYLELREQADFLARKLFSQYGPTTGPHLDFMSRLERWIEICPAAHKKTLFRSVTKLFFIGHDETAALCRTAFQVYIYRWLIDSLRLDVLDPALESLLVAGIDQTWICPITDSMPVAQFCHVNGVSGQRHRPDWRSLALFADPSKLQAYADSEKLERLVLLEDFVGTGTQMKSAVRFAAESLPNMSILVAPLICCPRGVTAGLQLAAEYSNISFQPTLQLNNSCLLSRLPLADEDPYFKALRAAVVELHPLLEPFQNKHDNNPFGFRDTGALVVQASNCPNNAPPLLHHKSANWEPLFPRISRT